MAILLECRPHLQSAAASQSGGISLLTSLLPNHLLPAPFRIPFSAVLPFDDETVVPHAAWMRKALDQAMQAFEQDEVPVGAVIVYEGRVIGEGYNQRETLQDPTAHAEMLAMTQAAQELGSWRLLDCTLYVTLEPCPMCGGDRPVPAAAADLRNDRP